MKLGLVLNSQFRPDQDPVVETRNLIEQVRLSRDAGLNGIYIVQHFLSDPYQAIQLWPLLGRIAAESGEMQIGSSILLLTLFNPIYAAEHAASLDILTGGRFALGVGLGFRDEEFHAFGIDPRDRAARFNESMSLLMRLLRGEEVTHAGKFFKLDGAVLRPTPIQKPYPPVWMAASGDLGVKRAARHGVPWLINPHATIGTIAAQQVLYRETLIEYGHTDPHDVPIFRELAIAPTREQAVHRSASYLEGKYSAYAKWGLDKPMPEHERLQAPFEELAEDRFIVGSPEQCLNQIHRYQEVLGANILMARVQWPGMSQRDTLDQIEMLGNSVVPELQHD